VSVENQNNSTLIEIIGRPLVGEGRPDISRPSNGRFIAEIPGFVDPVINSGPELTAGFLDAPHTEAMATVMAVTD